MPRFLYYFFFFNDTATTEIYTLSLHDALPICCQVFCKPASDGMEVPMHQDGHYWPIQPLATCTAWVAIDDSNVGNGCLRVIPGSHSGQHYYQHSKSDREHLVLNQHVDDPRVDIGNAVDVELSPGQFSLHDVYMIHGSNPNTSNERRAGVAIRYMPATSHFNRSLYEKIGRAHV